MNFWEKAMKHPVYGTRSGEKYIRPKIPECFFKTFLWSRLQLGQLLYFYLQKKKTFYALRLFRLETFFRTRPFSTKLQIPKIQLSEMRKTTYRLKEDNILKNFYPKNIILGLTGKKLVEFMFPLPNLFS